MVLAINVISVLPALALTGHKKGEENECVALQIACMCTCPKYSAPQANTLFLRTLPHTCINTMGRYPHRHHAHGFLHLNTTVTHMPIQ